MIMSIFVAAADDLRRKSAYDLSLDCLHKAASSASAAVQLVHLMIVPQVHLRKPCYDFYFL